MTVIDFKKTDRFNTLPKSIRLDRKPTDWGKCRHDNATFQIDEHERKVFCSVCEKQVDPILVLSILMVKKWKSIATEEDKHLIEENMLKRLKGVALNTLIHKFNVTPEKYKALYDAMELSPSLTVGEEKTG